MTQILHSKIVGKGFPLVILHGFLGSGDNWISLGRKFAEHFEVHLVDLRNHGKSFHKDKMDFETLAEDLINYFDYYHLKSINILGHSMGGKVAMYTAINHPKQIHKIIVADIAPKSYPRGHDFILEALQEIDFSIHKSRSDFDKILQKHIQNKAIRQFLLKNIYRKSKAVFDFRFNLKALVDNYENILEALPTFSQFHGKVLFLKGENSDYIQQQDKGLIMAHFPMAEIHSIQNAGHWLHAENPEDFYKESIYFLLNE